MNVKTPNQKLQSSPWKFFQGSKHVKSLQKLYVPPLSAQSESRLDPKERELWFSEILDGAS